MKRLMLLLCTLMLCLMEGKSQELPLFSDNTVEHYYYIEFEINSSVIQDVGAGLELRNRAIAENEPRQLWKFIGNENSCIAISKNGNQLYYNSSMNRFYASRNEGTEMRFVATSGAKWELHIGHIACSICQPGCFGYCNERR